MKFKGRTASIAPRSRLSITAANGRARPHLLAALSLLATVVILPSPASALPCASGTAGDDVIDCTDGLTHAGPIAAQAGSDVVNVDNGTVIDGVLYLGTTTIDSTADQDTLNLVDGSITGNLFGDAGADILNLSGGVIGQAGAPVEVDLRGGSDTVNLDGATIYGNLRTGDGNDSLSLSSGTISADADAGAGGDNILLDGASIGDNLVGGVGSDTIVIRSGSVTNSVFLGNFIGTSTDADTLTMTGGTVGAITGDDGVDEITLSAGTVNGVIYLRAGDDVAHLDNVGVGLDLVLGTGADRATVANSTIAGNVNLGDIVAGPSNDANSLVITDSSVGTALTGDAGADDIRLVNTSVGDFLDSKEGDDIVEINNSSVVGLLALGAGNDRLTMTESAVGDWVFADDGNDILTFTDVDVNGYILGLSGDDSFEMTRITATGVVLGGFDASATTDTDRLVMTDSDISIVVLGDDGVDDIQISGSIIGLDIATNGGDDSAILEDTTVNRDVLLGTGSDTLSLDATTLIANRIDGGDDASSADGWIDVVTFTGANFVMPDAATRLINWETVALIDSTVDLTGLVTENVTLDNGSLTLTDASVSRNISGGAGNESVTLAGSTGVGGGISLGNGSDALTVDGPDVTIAGAIDGGDDVESGDGFIDTLSFVNGAMGVFTAANWEVAAIRSGSDITLQNSTVGEVQVDNATATLTDTRVNSFITGSPGQETVTLTGSTSVRGGVELGDGSDALTIDGPGVSVEGTIDGGDDIGDGDGFTDTLNFINGVTGVFNPVNWEVAGIRSGSDVTLTGGALGEVQVDNASATLTDTTVTGDIVGGDGEETVALTGSTSIGGNVSLGSGSDTLTLAGGSLTLGGIVDGGDDAGSGDGFTDALILDGYIGSLRSPANWERIAVENATALSLVGDTTFGQLQITNGSVDMGNGPIALTGDIDIAARGILEGTGGGSGVYILDGDVFNAGIITTADDAVGDRLTVGGDYRSDGGALWVDTVLDGDGSPTDRVAFDADVTGDPLLNVNNAGGQGALTNSGIEVIQTGPGVTGTFTLDGDYTDEEGDPVVVGGAYGYRLEPGDDGTWRLVSRLDAEPETPLYQILVPAYEVLPQVLLALDELPTLQQRVGNRSWLLPRKATQIEAEGNTVWARIVARQRDMDSEASTTEASFDSRFSKLQFGVDIPLRSDERGSLIAGVNASYIDSDTDVDSFYGASRIDGTGYSLGLTGTWYVLNGAYVDAQAQYTWADFDISAQQIDPSGIDGEAYSLSIETGRRYVVDESRNLSVTPQLQLRYTSADVDEQAGTFDERVSVLDAEALVSRIGVSLDHEREWTDDRGRNNRVHSYGIVNLLHAFDDSTASRVSGVDFDNRIDDNALELGIGGSYNWADDKYSVHAEISRVSSPDDLGENTGIKGEIGLRVRF